MSSTTDDDVVEYWDTQYLSSLVETPCYGDVLLAWLRVTARVIVCNDQCNGAGVYCGSENRARMHQRRRVVANRAQVNRKYVIAIVKRYSVEALVSETVGQLSDEFYDTFGTANLTVSGLGLMHDPKLDVWNDVFRTVTVASNLGDWLYREWCDCLVSGNQRILLCLRLAQIDALNDVMCIEYAIATLHCWRCHLARCNPETESAVRYDVERERRQALVGCVDKSVD